MTIAFVFAVWSQSLLSPEEDGQGFARYGEGKAGKHSFLVSLLLAFKSGLQMQSPIDRVHIFDNNKNKKYRVLN